MTVDFSKIEGEYLRDLLDQPRALAATAQRLEHLPPLPDRAQKTDRIVLTGMGSSLFALQPLLIRLVASGRTALLVETAELIHSQRKLVDGRTLIVAVSQSGQSVEIVQLLDLVAMLPSQAFVIGVTNTADSPLAQRANYVVPTEAGLEFSVSCKTYLTALLALEWLGNALQAEPGTPFAAIDEAAAVVKYYFASWREEVQWLANEHAGTKQLFLAGRGTSLAAVGTGALILKESTRFHAEGMSAPAFRHGPLEMVSPGLCALVFAGDPTTAPLNHALIRRHSVGRRKGAPDRRSGRRRPVPNTNGVLRTSPGR